MHLQKDNELSILSDKFSILSKKLGIVSNKIGIIVRAVLVHAAMVRQTLCLI